jgi:hypothetical protein
LAISAASFRSGARSWGVTRKWAGWIARARRNRWLGERAAISVAAISTLYQRFSARKSFSGRAKSMNYSSPMAAVAAFPLELERRDFGRWRRVDVRGKWVRVTAWDPAR